MGKVIKYSLLAVFLIFLILLLVPWLFKDQIFAKVQEEANKNLKGELVIGDLGLSLIRDFPNLTLVLDDMSYTGEGAFQNNKLFIIKQVKAELDLMSVFKGESIHVLEIQIDQPNLDVKILKDGTANYDILKEQEEVSTAETETEEAATFNLGIDRFIINGLNLTYNDQEGGIFSAIENGNLILRGRFSEVETDVNSEITIDALTVALGQVSYLNKVKVSVLLDALYNQETGKLDLGENEVALNELNLLFNGWLQSFEEKVALDLNFESPGADFKEILSLVPSVYTADFSNVKASGSFSVKGNVTGDYFYKGEDMPGFDLAIDVKNGQFRYPDLPASVDNIFITSNINHPQGDLDELQIKTDASLNLAGSPFKANMFLKTPMSDPYIDLKLKTDLDLGKLAQVVPIEGTTMQGILIADAFVKGNMSQFEKEEYNKVEAGGWLNTKGLNLSEESINESLIIDTAYAEVTPKYLNVPALRMTIGESDFSGSGKLYNMLGYALADDTLSGNLVLNSTFTNVNQLMGMLEEEDVEGVSNPEDSAAISEVAVIPGNLDLGITANADRVLYDDLELKNLSGKLTIKDSKAILKDFQMDMLQGKLFLNGDYSTPNNKPLVHANMELKSVDAKAAFTGLNTVQAFAPVANATSGSFTTKLTYEGLLKDDLSPDLNSVRAKGNLYTLGLLIQPEIMKTISGILNDSRFDKVRFQDADLSFEINDGRIKVSPVKVFIGDLKAEFSGSHGLDQTLDYLLSTTVAIDKIDMPEEIKSLGLLKGSIPVQFKIGGTLDKPTVKPVFGKATGTKEIIKDIVDNVVTEVKDSVINTVNKEAERIMAEAQAQADKLMKDAELQAQQIKEEAATQAQKLKDEARKQADKLIAEAKGDPLKEIGARTAADLAIKEADKKIDKLLKDANNKADGVVAAAKKESDRILKETEERAKIAN